jgi:hypothetical protein
VVGGGGYACVTHLQHYIHHLQLLLQLTLRPGDVTRIPLHHLNSLKTGEVPDVVTEAGKALAPEVIIWNCLSRVPDKDGRQGALEGEYTWV